MSLWAIVPVKPLRMGKSRLAQVLTDEQRYELNQRMLKRTVSRLRRVKWVEYVLVVSRDPEALSIARLAGARTLLEDGKPGLNIALTRASVLAKAYGAHGVLIVPSDLPLLDAADLERIITQGGNGSSIVIVPDHRGDGTNLLLISPPDGFPFDYGPGSFERHIARARQLGQEPIIIRSDSIALDVDWPEDLELLGEILRIDLEPNLNGSSFRTQ